MGKNTPEQENKEKMQRWADHSVKVAQYIFDTEEKSYVEFIQDGGDPMNHVFYSAAVVLGREEELLFY